MIAREGGKSTRRLLRFARFLWERRADLDMAISRSWALGAFVVSGGMIAAIVAAVSSIPVWVWIPLGAIVIILFELIILLVLNIRRLIIQLHGSPLEIIYKPERGKYFLIEPILDDKGNIIVNPLNSFLEYRAIARNTSWTTIKNVKVIVEAIGQMPYVLNNLSLMLTKNNYAI